MLRLALRVFRWRGESCEGLYGTDLRFLRHACEPNREALVATHLSFPSVCHVAVDGDAFRWVPGPWEY